MSHAIPAPDVAHNPGLIAKSLVRRFWACVEAHAGCKAFFRHRWGFLENLSPQGAAPERYNMAMVPAPADCPVLAAYPEAAGNSWFCNQALSLTLPIKASVFTPINRLDAALEGYALVWDALLKTRCQQSADLGRARWLGEDDEPRAQDLDVSGPTMSVASPNPEDPAPMIVTRLDFTATFTAMYHPNLALG